MKKAIAILLVLLVAGVMFGDVITTEDNLVINATQGLKAEFIVTQSTAAGAGGEGKLIDLDGTAFRTGGVTIANWTFESNTKLTPTVTITWNDFTSSTVTTESAVSYQMSFNGGTTYEADKSIAYTSLVRQGGTAGPFLKMTAGNYNNILIKALDDETTKLFSEAPDYTSTIQFAITAE